MTMCTASTIARRIGVKLELSDFGRFGAELPCLVNPQPSGQHLMEERYHAGGLPAAGYLGSATARVFPS
jgi:dihydroxyacid dehydratase/phosphogluconate dehydratase